MNQFYNPICPLSSSVVCLLTNHYEQSTMNQKLLIMQNKANFQKAQMNASTVVTKDYENETLGERGKNKAKTNPNKANFQKSPNERKCCFNKELQ